MKKVFFLGDVALDEYYQADYFPKIKEKIIVHTMPAQMGGSMANAACVFRALGNPTYFLTALNSGAITQRLLKGLNDAGINTDYMVFDDSIPDSKCIIILAEEEHTVFIPTLALEKIEIDEKTFHELCSCDYIYSNFCEVGPLRYQDKGAAKLLDTFRKNGVKLWCDLDCAELSEEEERLFSYLDTAFVNEMGERNLSGRFGENWKQVLFEKGVNLIIVTRAEKGCSVYQGGQPEINVPGVKTRVCDVTGAGDTFGSAFLHAYMHSSDLTLCAEFANYTAARAVTGLGARYGAAAPAVLRDFIEEHGGDPGRYQVFLEEETV